MSRPLFLSKGTEDSEIQKNDWIISKSKKSDNDNDNVNVNVNDNDNVNENDNVNVNDKYIK